MKNLQEATERICDLKGSLIAHDALISAMLQQLPLAQREALLRSLTLNAEVARTVLLHSPVSELTVNAFEQDIDRMSSLLRSELAPG